jgi:hypothetical protein
MRAMQKFAYAKRGERYQRMAELDVEPHTY